MEINNLEGSDSGADPDQFETSANAPKRVGDAYVIPEGLLSHKLGPHVDKVEEDVGSADSYYVSQLSNNTTPHHGGHKSHSHHKLLGSVHSMHSEVVKPKSDNGAMDHELAQFGTGVEIGRSQVETPHTMQASQHQSRKTSAHGQKEEHTQSAQFVSNGSVTASS